MRRHGLVMASAKPASAGFVMAVRGLSPALAESGMKNVDRVLTCLPSGEGLKPLTNPSKPADHAMDLSSYLKLM